MSYFVTIPAAFFGFNGIEKLIDAQHDQGRQLLSLVTLFFMRWRLSIITVLWVGASWFRSTVNTYICLSVRNIPNGGSIQAVRSRG